MSKVRERIETGHKTFDSQVDYVGTGNVVSGVQFSAYVRAASDTACNGFAFKPGELRAADLKAFSSLPRHIEAAVLNSTRDEQVILYKFRHKDGGREVVHGYVLTRDDYGQNELLGYWSTGPTSKSYVIMEAMKKIVSTPPGTVARMRSETIPSQIADMQAFIDGKERAGVRETVMEIARIIGSDPDIGARTENYSGWHEARNIWRALAEPEAAEHFRFSIAGTEALAAANAVIDRPTPVDPGDNFITLGDGVRAVLRGVLSIAGDEEKYGKVDPSWTMQEFVAKAAGRDLEAKGPVMR